MENLEVTLTAKTIVKAAAIDPSSEKLHRTLALSNLDLLSGRFPVTYLYFYTNSHKIDFPCIMDSLRLSLARTLHYYYPFSGRIAANPATAELEIICDNQGVLVVEARANVPLKRLNFYDLDKLVTQGKLVSLCPDFLFQVQVTRYTCGGVSMTFTFDHALGDAASFSKFLLSWSEIARSKSSSLSSSCLVPDHRRRELLRPRDPPRYNPSMDHTFASCTIDDILNMPIPTATMVKRLYHIDAGCINRLQMMASAPGGTTRTKIEAFSAYIWKAMVKAVDGNKECKMGWLVDGRGRMGGNDSMSNYIGNVLSLAVGEATVDDLKRGSIADVAGRVHEAISEATREEHFLELVDWIECHRPGLVMARIVLGGGGSGPSAVVVSSGRRFPVAELEFGFGSPVLGTVSSTIERIGVGYLNQRESGKNDGCWTVSAILWPQLVEVLESDSVFQPISATQHLLL